MSARQWRISEQWNAHIASLLSAAEVMNHRTRSEAMHTMSRAAAIVLSVGIVAAWTLTSGPAKDAVTSGPQPAAIDTHRLHLEVDAGSLPVQAIDGLI